MERLPPKMRTKAEARCPPRLWPLMEIELTPVSLPVPWAGRPGTTRDRGEGMGTPVGVGMLTSCLTVSVAGVVSRNHQLTMSIIWL